MNRDVAKERIEKILLECDSHLRRMSSAASKMVAFMPLDEQKYSALTDDEVEHIDQFLFRFSKLQDSIGQKLFKAMLIYLEEDVEEKPFIDILNQLEKLHLLESASDWRKLREDRNELAHQYENEPEQMSAAINRVYERREMLVDIYHRLKSAYLKAKGAHS